MKAESNLPAVYARVIVDTNVLLSAALLPQSVPAILVDHLLQGSRLVFSTATFAELETRIWKPKFDRYLSMEMRRNILRDIDASALWVTAPAELSVRTYCRDAADDVFVHAALAGNVCRLITGDEDLLVLHPFDTIHILSPRAALDEIKKFHTGIT